MTYRASTPVEDSQAAQQFWEAALGSEAVRRIFARGGDHPRQFVEAVQAADTTSLAHLLNDDLIVYLQSLLEDHDLPNAFRPTTKRE